MAGDACGGARIIVSWDRYSVAPLALVVVRGPRARGPATAAPWRRTGTPSPSRELLIAGSFSFAGGIPSGVASPDSDQDSKLMTAASDRGVSEAQGRDVEIRKGSHVNPVVYQPSPLTLRTFCCTMNPKLATCQFGKMDR
jgi:hypothetical protein